MGSIDGKLNFVLKFMRTLIVGDAIIIMNLDNVLAALADQAAEISVIKAYIAGLQANQADPAKVQAAFDAVTANTANLASAIPPTP
jgi:hypothetical protein